MKGQTIFGNRVLFLTCSWRFLRSNKSEQLGIIQIGIKYWDLETCAGKVRKYFLASFPSEFNLKGYLAQDGLQCEQCYLKQTLALKKEYNLNITCFL